MADEGTTAPLFVALPAPSLHAHPSTRWASAAFRHAASPRVGLQAHFGALPGTASQLAQPIVVLADNG